MYNQTRVSICKQCGREFVKAPQTVFGEYCCYTCKQASEREHDEILRRRGQLSRLREEERRKKLKGRKSSPKECRYKPVNQFTLDGKFVARYESQKMAAEVIMANETSISQCIRGKQKTAGGYIWRRAEKENDHGKT